MVNIQKKYKVSTGSTEKKLKKNGFRNGTYKSFVYKNLIQIKVHIDIEERWWSYQILNHDTHNLYIPYYDRNYGESDVITEIDNTVNEILNSMVIAGILKLSKKKKDKGV